MSIVFSIEGNIGSGKSTFVNYLRENFADLYIFLEEPVNQWKEIKDAESGKNKIELFYEDMKTHSFSFQMMAYISRLSSLRTAIRENPGKKIICERSIYTDRHVFAKMLHEDKMISSTDYQIYLKWFDHFVEDLPSISYIYIKCDPEVAIERIRKRARPGEESITLEYITRVHNAHEEWLTNNTVLSLDGNVNKSKLSDYNDWFSQVQTFTTTPVDVLRSVMSPHQLLESALSFGNDLKPNQLKTQITYEASPEDAMKVINQELYKID